MDDKETDAKQEMNAIKDELNRKRMLQNAIEDELKRIKLATSDCSDTSVGYQLNKNEQKNDFGGLLTENVNLQDDVVSSTQYDEYAESLGTKLVMAVPETVSSINSKKGSKKKKSQNTSKLKCSGTDSTTETSDYENEIDEVLEEMAYKNNLSTFNVKNILRHVITNKHVLAMVRKTMGDETSDMENIDEYLFEPKLTRSKTKELIEKQANIPWPISPIKNPLVSVPSSSRLMEADFSEDESSDEEYTPDHESEEEEKQTHSELDQLAVDVENYELVNNSTVGDATTISTSIDTKNVDTIALRTRSKLPLTDTPLESLEATLVAPDITVDMYDSECDDEEWKNFLKEFVQPTNASGDDETEDPEYNFLEEEEILDREDMRNDRAVKITKKELGELMAELFEAAEMELADFEDDNEISETANVVKLPKSGEYASNLAINQVANNDTTSPSLFTSMMRQQLDEQMRMHVQLLTQGFILSASVDELKSLNEDYKMLLVELQAFAIKNTFATGQTSAFHAHNLTDAVSLISEFKEKRVHCLPIKINKKQKKTNKAKMISGYGLTAIAMETIYRSKVCMYSELLPVCGFIQQVSKVFFTEAEDNLIVLGLEQFCDLKNVPIPQLIRENMLPTKTERQIQLHMKNQKSTKASDNPIKSYFQNKILPTRKQMSTFEPIKVCAPCDQPFRKLPRWIQKRINTTRVQKGVSICPTVTPKPPLYTAISELQLSKNASGVPVINDEHPIAILKKPKGSIPASSGNNLFIDSTGNVIYVPSSVRTVPVNEKPSSHISLDKREMATKACQVFSPGKQIQLAIQSQSSKRISPLKHVSPILKKYSPKKMRKTGGNLRATLPILPKLYISPVKQDNRLIAPKPTVAEIATVEQSEVSIEQLASQDQKKTLQPLQKEVKYQINLAASKNTQSSDDITSPIVDSQSDQEMFEDEELQDNAEDLAALMAASSTIQSAPRGRQHASRKHAKQQKETEVMLELLAPNLLNSDPLLEDRDTALAQDYLQRVQEATANNPKQFAEFLKLLYEFGQSDKSVIQLNNDVCEMLKEHPNLCDEFSMFLLPEQAVECGKIMQHFQFTQMRLFLRKVEVYFKKHPQPFQKITKVLNQCKQEVYLGIEHIKQLMQPVLRNQAHLMEEFLLLFPKERPPENHMTDFEEVQFPDDDIDIDEDGFEVVTLLDEEDEYGGKNCKCDCHIKTDDVKMLNRVRHCLPCGIRFVDGRIYVQAGKGLKPVQVVTHNSPEHASTPKQHIVTARNMASKFSLTMSSCNDQSKHDGLNAVKSLPLVAVQPSNSCLSSSKLCNETSSPVNKSALMGSIISSAKTHSKEVSQLSNYEELPSKFDASDDGLFNMDCSREINQCDLITKLFNSVETDDSTSGISAKNHSVDDKGEVVVLWTRGADRLILSTCQQMGATDAAFEKISSILGNKSPMEVKKRLSELMKLFSVHQKKEFIT